MECQWYRTSSWHAMGTNWGTSRREGIGARTSSCHVLHTCSCWLFREDNGDHSNPVTGSQCRWSGSASSSLGTCLATADPTMKSHKIFCWKLVLFEGWATFDLTESLQFRAYSVNEWPNNSSKPTNEHADPLNEPMSPLMQLSGQINTFPNSSACWISMLRTVLVGTLEPWNL